MRNNPNNNDAVQGSAILWSKFESASKVLASVIIPAAIAVTGYYYTNKNDEARLRNEYVKIAVGVLQDSQTSAKPNIRRWAVQLINHYSEVKMDNATKKELSTHSLSQHINLSALQSIVDKSMK